MPSEGYGQLRALPSSPLTPCFHLHHPPIYLLHLHLHLSPPPLLLSPLLFLFLSPYTSPTSINPNTIILIIVTPISTIFNSSSLQIYSLPSGNL